MAGQGQDKGLINLCGMWQQTAQGGRKYLSGRLGVGGKVMLFRNDKKRTDKDPDYYLVLGEWKRADDRQEGRDDSPVPF